MSLYWRVGQLQLPCFERTHVMGVINVTPDSFSDGGTHYDPEVAVAAGIRMVSEGADILDVGGESTRPGSEAVPTQEEMERVLPVVKRLTAEVDVPVSIDTRKPQVAAAALDAGASIVNDVTGGRDPEMLELAADRDSALVLMHMKGEPKTMQDNPTYDDVVGEVRKYLERQAEAAVRGGLARDRIAIDPGLGFGKTFQHNMVLMRDIGAFADLGLPVVVGPSRKSFVGAALGDLPVEDRLEGTAAAVALLAYNGAHVIRVHDVKEMARVVRVVDAIKRG
ncbi:MAG TPA: dihydropteroate synthase [Actinomycetota bacterium]|nr:dihydropteroate synthase [Actinomycetota bacterium]